MEIKTATMEDIGILALVVRQANIPVARQFNLTRENAPAHPSFCTRDWIASGMHRGEIYFLLEVKGMPVGCVAYESPEPELAYLNRLAVLPEYQNLGAGEKLVNHLVDLARSRGKTKVSIGIIKAHTRLRDWYRRLGFMPTGEKQFDHLPFDVLFMERPISSKNPTTQFSN